MKSIIMNVITIVILVVLAATAVANMTVDINAEPASTAIVRDYNDSNYSIPVEKFDIESIGEKSTLYIEWNNSDGVEKLGLEHFAWRKDGQLFLTHSGLDWWLQKRGVVTQNNGGDRWSTCLTPEGMFLIDTLTGVEWEIPFAAGTDYAVTATDAESVLQEAGLL